MAPNLTVRPLTAADNAAAAAVIKTVMPEFGCVGPGYSIEDPEMDDLYGTYSKPRSNYFVVQDLGAAAGAGEVGKQPSPPPGKLVAVAGYAPLTGGDPNVCELRKMYALPEARGLGVGQALLQQCLEGARKDGFKTMYLETVTAMRDAAAFYQKNGFRYVEGPMGATGHSGCDLFMVLDL
ncbi:GNAT family N-acetyltransferase [Lewinella sp. 4G2]|uniref:GNAT family N-acetyltransferase n=1 Tax=Lewinella sp. 4G2 TaxID=1803372 RepID=UPI0007DE6BDE|nr:GNAT family N-acetyltransferase [Lewinella sp. 4G2]OAV44234.1 acetyltransferase [Lewinella sp. 4G2]